MRYYINNIYSNWILFLFIVQLALNTKISNITKVTLFFANYSKKLNFFEKKYIYLSAQSAIKKIAILKKIYNNISKIQEKSIKYQNKKQKTIFQLKKKNKIYFFTKNLKTKKLNKKLDYIKVESFFIKKTKKSVNYKLDLFKNIKVFSVFYILLLKSADSSIFIQKILYYKLQKKNRYKIEQILKQQNQKYLIK